MRLTHLRKTLFKLLLDFVAVMSFVVVVVIISSNVLKEFVINFRTYYFKTMLYYLILFRIYFRKCIFLVAADLIFTVHK